MTNQVLRERYFKIEKLRAPLKERYEFLKETKGDEDEIERIGRKLTELTFNQAHILIDLNREE